MSADPGSARLAARIELAATIILATATVLTAWSAFQATKWSGVQANSYAASAARRTEGTRHDIRAGQLADIDVETYLAWVQAVSDELHEDPSQVLDEDGNYAPRVGTLSGFLFARMRDEFQPAIHAWVREYARDPDSAPATPFDMASYELADEQRARELLRSADELASRARAANQRSDNYVFLVVLFAAVLFFAGVSGKLESNRSRLIMTTLAVVLLVSGIAILATFPVEI